MTQRARRHHHVPQFYLRRFTASNGLLWMHDLKTAHAREVAPIDALVESYLYSPETGDDPHNDEIETFLADHVDGPAVEPIARLASGELLVGEDRERVALFIAFQQMRVPNSRDTVQGFIEQVGDHMLRILARPERIRNTFAEMGKSVSESEIQTIVKLVQDGSIRSKATKIPWFQAMGVATRTARIIDALPWTVTRAPDNVEFVTSDVPVVNVLTDPSVPRQFEGGWLSPSAESTFPLDPRTCLAIVPGGKEEVSDVTEKWCIDVNRRTAHRARRFLVSQQRAAGESAIASVSRGTS